MRRRFMNRSNSVPLSFEALEDGLSISFTNEISYRINGGAWETLLAGENTEEVNKGSMISFRHSKSIGITGTVGQFSINKKCNVSGVCSSITPKFLGEKHMMSNLFQYLFYDCDTIVDASKLELPATTLADSCYNCMFGGCTSLTTAPKLPATALANYCYENMFYGCISLTTLPKLPATILAKSCYSSMFRDCTSLTTAPELPATTLADSCYSSMFANCESLTTAPELPATTLAKSCYDRMFFACRTLTAIPSILPAISLKESCYASMFKGCSSLTTAPELPATTLKAKCYSAMFHDCTSLTTAPELPAYVLEEDCYYSMFSHCLKLSYIKAMFVTVPGESFTFSWVIGVSSTGTFVKNKRATWNVIGVDGVPSGWTIKTE